MAQARITGTEVIERKLHAHLLEVVKYFRCGGRILHQEGFSEFKFQIIGL